MPSNVVQAGQYLIEVFFDLYILAFMLRFLFQWARVDFYNPFSQFLVKVTNPLLAPLRRIIPGFFGLDMAALVIMILLQLAKLYLVGHSYVMLHIPGLLEGNVAPFLPLLVLSISDLLSLVFYVFMFSIFIQAIISWINPGSYNPMSSLLYGLNEPLLRPVRRYIPTISGLDLSPLVVIIALQLLRILIFPPLINLAYRFY